MIRIVGHRGASGRAPENTLAAIRRAWEIGVDAVEFDVRLTADGHAVLLHDATLDRTTSGGGLLSERTLAEVQSLDAGAWFDPVFAGERVPTLAEALAAGQEAATVSWMIELKAGNSPPARAARTGGAARVPSHAQRGCERLVANAIAVIQEAGAASTSRLISFDETVLSVAREAAPGIPRGIIGEEEPSALLAAAERLECVAIHAASRLVTPEFVAAARAAGRQVNVWTLNDREAILLAAGLGVDEITTDVPDVALACLCTRER